MSYGYSKNLDGHGSLWKVSLAFRKTSIGTSAWHHKTFTNNYHLSGQLTPNNPTVHSPYTIPE